MAGWSGDDHRTADRRFVAALHVDSTGGRGHALYVEGAYVVLDACSARELGRVPYEYRGDDPPTRLELDLERGDDGRERVIARTIATDYYMPDRVASTHTFDAPTQDEIGAPPSGPHLLFELADPPVTRARLVNAVDALRGRLSRTPDFIGRDPRAVRLVAENRIAVERCGARAKVALRALELDRPAILEMPPFDVLVDASNELAPPDMMQLRLNTTCSEPVPERVEVRIDGTLLGSVPSAIIPRGRGHVTLPPHPTEKVVYDRLVRYPLKSRLRRILLHE